MIPSDPDPNVSPPGWPSGADPAVDAARAARRAQARLPVRPWAAEPRVRPSAAEPRVRPSAAEPRAALLLQPIHRIEGGRLLGAEVTETWPCPASAMPVQAAPSDAALLLQRACRAAMAWPDPPGQGLTVSVRMPAGSTCDRLLVAAVRAVLDATGRPPHGLELGLDETGLEEACSDGLLSLSAVRDLGVGLALDGVAGAPSVLRRLRRLPLTCLRLHPAMVSRLESCRDARRAAAASIRAAHALDAMAVAIGIDRAVQRDILAEFGCDAAQGGLFGAPMPTDAFAASIRHAHGAVAS